MENMIKKLTIKNFRFCVFIIGIILLFLGMLARYFGEDPSCPYVGIGQCDFWIVADYTFRMMIFDYSFLAFAIGGLISIISLFFYFHCIINTRP